MKFWDPKRKNKYLTEIFHFGSCNLEKRADSAFLALKGLIPETVKARAKRTKLWITKGKTSI